MSQSTRQPVVLRIHKGNDLIGVKQYFESQVVMGSQSDVQLPLDGQGISVIHCALEERDGVWYLADLGSESGTKRNGEVVLDSAIDSGDTISIGDYRIEFFIGVPKPSMRPTGSPIPTPKPSTTTISVTDTVTNGQAPSLAGLTPPPTAAQSPVTSQAAPRPASARPTVDIVHGQLETVSARPIRTTVKKDPKSKRGRKTFAPPSRYTNVKEFVKPTKGSVVEVMVAWRERVIATYSFAEKMVVTIGSQPDCHVPIPIMGARLRRAPIVKVGQPTVVFILPESDGEIVRGQSAQPFAELARTGRISRNGEMASLALEQGELVKMDVGDGISVIIRYVGEVPKPVMAPMLDLTTSEVTGVVLAMALVAVLSLYMYLYTPHKELPPEAGLDEPLRTVLVVAPTPIPPPPPPVAPQVVEPVATPAPTPLPQVVKATPAPVKQEIKPKEQQAKSVVTKRDNGVSASAVPNRNQQGPRQQTSVKQGGSTKTTDAKAAQMQSKSKDASKAGIFSTFGGGGQQNTLAGSTTGSGELAGLSANATGKSGMNENRAGEGLGSNVKDTGQGGTGKALEGIAGGVSTQGRGGGNSGYGTAGLGTRVGVKVVPGGEGESFSGTIDKEAIRRVIMANYRVIKACYERELNRTPDLVGKLVIEWDIGEKGAVLRTAVASNDLGNRAVAECLMGRLRTWRFPEPPTNQVVTVAYPFVFSN